MFYESKTLNMLSILMAFALLCLNYTDRWMIPAICMAAMFLFAIGYTIWFWWKKPAAIARSKWLSDVAILFIIYFLIVAAMQPKSEWWLTFDALATIAAITISLLRDDRSAALTAGSDDRRVNDSGADNGK